MDNIQKRLENTKDGEVVDNIRDSYKFVNKQWRHALEKIQDKAISSDEFEESDTSDDSDESSYDFYDSSKQLL